MVSDSKCNCIFIKVKGNILYEIVNLDFNVYGSYGLYIVNIEGELKNIFYVYGDNNICKVLIDFEIIIFIEKIDLKRKI